MSSNPRREELKAISAPFKILLQEGAIDTINEALCEMYKSQGHRELKTIHQWNEEGCRVKKGEKALLLWGKPRDKKKLNEAKEEGASEEEIETFFPVAYVFSNNQITKS